MMITQKKVKRSLLFLVISLSVGCKSLDVKSDSMKKEDTQTNRPDSAKGIYTMIEHIPSLSEMTAIQFEEFYSGKGFKKVF